MIIDWLVFDSIIDNQLLVVIYTENCTILIYTFFVNLLRYISWKFFASHRLASYNFGFCALISVFLLMIQCKIFLVSEHWFFGPLSTHFSFWSLNSDLIIENWFSAHVVYVQGAPVYNSHRKVLLKTYKYVYNKNVTKYIKKSIYKC